MNKSKSKATFGAGCFWGVEEKLRKLKGVISTTVGYSGGDFSNPSYINVCSGTTGHAEVVQIEFDPSIITYEELLETFWKIHNPTTLNRQGWDVGEQYRSVIFYHTPEQREKALESKKNLEESGSYKKPIVTEIKPVKEFYRAEEYHQKYIQKKSQTPFRF
jgi:peptide-methionine (S)-S-oxide reductase